MLREFSEVDGSHRNIGDSIKVRDLKLQEGITVLDHEDTILASVTAPKTTVKAEIIEEQEQAPAEESQEQS